MLLLFGMPTAEAAGFYTTTSGTKAMSRGGAFIASADDLSSQFHNPAGLIRLNQTQVMLSSSLVETAASFEREGFGAADETGKPAPIPSIAFATKLGLENTTFAFGFYTPMAPDLLFPEDGAQRYSLVDSLEWQGYVGPSAAHRFSDRLTLGLGLQWAFLRADRLFAITSCNPEVASACVDDPTFDITSDMQAFDPFEFTANAGMLFEATDQLGFGLSVQLPVSFAADASLTTTLAEEHPFKQLVEGDSFTDDEATLLINFPMIIRAGASYAFSDRFDLELAGAYQGWNVNDEIVLTDLDITIPLSESGQLLSGGVTESLVTDDVVLKMNYVDSYSVRLGGEFDASDMVSIRAGSFFETSAVPNQSLNASTLDANKIGGGIGATLRPHDRVDILVALAHNQFLIPDITDSEHAQMVLDLDPADPASSTIVDGETVGNGSWNASTTIGSVGLTWRFGG